MRWLVAVFYALMPLVAEGEAVVVGFNQTQVAITADFAGAEILIYGAIKRDAPAPQGDLDVIVTLQGPPEPVRIARKKRHFGIWLNTAQVRVDRAPSFYAVATTAPLAEILSETEDLRYKITIPRAIRAVGLSAQAENSPDFIDALLRIREDDGRYKRVGGAVILSEETLFRTDIMLPANLTAGLYTVRVFILREGRVVDHVSGEIDVKKAGIERILYGFAHKTPFYYGILSLFVAGFAGWGAARLSNLIKL